MAVTLTDIHAAARRIAGGVLVSPCPESISLSEITGARVYCKLDNLQRTGSFKERGARNALLQLPADRKTRGVIAASAGNHALGLAYHGKLLGVPVTVVMPDYAPLIKITTCQRLGARVLVRGRDFAEARAEADQLVAGEGLTYIHGFDNPDIIAGQGTMGLEILRQVPHLDAIVCPIGGAGLIAGIAIAVKAVRPKVQVIGVESVATASFTAAVKAGKPVSIPRAPTLADGLAVSDRRAELDRRARRPGAAHSEQGDVEVDLDQSFGQHPALSQPAAGGQRPLPGRLDIGRHQDDRLPFAADSRHGLHPKRVAGVVGDGMQFVE